MSDKKAESPGGWDAKINAKHKTKDAAGKARGYEDAEAQKREDGRSQETSRD
ncbi:hypothetical protein VQ042_24470 [Aurantimonas sp. A2-1-M11]|uniref:hypothetical protein n=1 Tax=Aurantimonas sp. A2-1-M11 TaxID=3113712 RepID=UPI002F92D623